MCIANNTWARPSPNIPEFDARVAEVYTVQHHDMRNGQRELRIYSAIPKDVSGKRPVLFMLDGNGLYPLAVNQAAQQFARDKLPIIIGIGYPSPEAFPKKNGHTTTRQKSLEKPFNMVVVQNRFISFSPSLFAHGLNNSFRLIPNEKPYLDTHLAVSLR